MIPALHGSVGIVPTYAGNILPPKCTLPPSSDVAQPPFRTSHRRIGWHPRTALKAKANSTESCQTLKNAASVDIYGMFVMDSKYETISDLIWVNRTVPTSDHKCLAFQIRNVESVWYNSQSLNVS